MAKVYILQDEYGVVVEVFASEDDAYDYRDNVLGVEGAPSAAVTEHHVL